MKHGPQMVNGYPAVCPNNGFGVVSARPCPTDTPWRVVTRRTLNFITLVGWECPFCGCVAKPLTPRHDDDRNFRHKTYEAAE